MDSKKDSTKRDGYRRSPCSGETGKDVTELQEAEEEQKVGEWTWGLTMGILGIVIGVVGLTALEFGVFWIGLGIATLGLGCDYWIRTRT